MSYDCSALARGTFWTTPAHSLICVVLMQPGFSVFEYASYFLGRWRFVLACCAAAAVIAGIISFLTPRRYTATATILIDAPAGNDPRASTAVSPVYLESLKTYQRLAESDSLFLKAIERFDLRASEGGAAADALKNRVLRVTKPRDTRMLEIQVTLRDPVKARDVCRFVAESTAELSRSLSRQNEDEFRREAFNNADAARKTLDEADRRYSAESQQARPESLETDLEAVMELKNRVRRDLLAVETEIAGQSTAEEPRHFGPDLVELRARWQALNKQLDSLHLEVQKRSVQLAQRQSILARLEAERKSARSIYDAAASRLNDTLAGAGTRGERLRVADPGTVPERPTSPKITLNVLGAIVIALAAAVLYLSIAFAFNRRKAVHEFAASYQSTR